MSDKQGQVFVIHGRNQAVRNSIFEFLRAIELRPMEWSTLTASAGQGTPLIGQLLDNAFQRAEAIVAVLTPDDIAHLHPQFHDEMDPAYEKTPSGQARPNVLFEMGMAFGRAPERTVIVEVGTLRPFSDIAGMHVVKLTNEPHARKEFASRLKACGCNVEISGNDWLNAGNFAVQPLQGMDVANPQDAPAAAALLDHLRSAPLSGADRIHTIEEIAQFSSAVCAPILKAIVSETDFYARSEIEGARIALRTANDGGKPSNLLLSVEQRSPAATMQQDKTKDSGIAFLTAQMIFWERPDKTKPLIEGLIKGLGKKDMTETESS